MLSNLRTTLYSIVANNERKQCVRVQVPIMPAAGKLALGDRESNNPTGPFPQFSSIQQHMQHSLTEAHGGSIVCQLGKWVCMSTRCQWNFRKLWRDGRTFAVLCRWRCWRRSSRGGGCIPLLDPPLVARLQSRWWTKRNCSHSCLREHTTLTGGMQALVSKHAKLVSHEESMQIYNLARWQLQLHTL